MKVWKVYQEITNTGNIYQEIQITEGIKLSKIIFINTVGH